MPRGKRILVFEKRARPTQVGRSRRGRGGSGRGSDERDPLILDLKDANQEHLRAKKRLHQLLDAMAVTVRYVTLPHRGARASSYDLVIALGGDGTVLHASHQIGDAPVLAINSSPHHSVGFLTATTIDNAQLMIERALAGDLRVTRLQRMAVDIDGRRVYGRVLNDVLFSHECPASTARYLLSLNEIAEDQMSSGIWVGPAAGSTAAQRAAGGRALPPRSRKIQFVVREPYCRLRDEPYQLVKGLVAPGEALRIRNKMTSARLYVDGPHVVIPVRFGETIELGLSETPLQLLAFQRP